MIATDKLRGDMQIPENQKQTPKDEISADEIIDQGSRPDADAIRRQIRRGDESKGDADERDVAGALDYEETPHGGEERKTQIKKEAETQ
jgi:hypothetical protein